VLTITVIIYTARNLSLSFLFVLKQSQVIVGLYMSAKFNSINLLYKFSSVYLETFFLTKMNIAKTNRQNIPIIATGEKTRFCSNTMGETSPIITSPAQYGEQAFVLRRFQVGKFSLPECLIFW
jgi:hypothetical protein